MSPILAWSAEECPEVDSYLSILPREEGADTCQTDVTAPHSHSQTMAAIHGFNKLSCPEAATVQKPLPHTATQSFLQKVSKSLCMLSRLDADFSGARCLQLQKSTSVARLFSLPLLPTAAGVSSLPGHSQVSISALRRDFGLFSHLKSQQMRSGA